jgi:hypothetical protein
VDDDKPFDPRDVRGECLRLVAGMIECAWLNRCEPSAWRGMDEAILRQLDEDGFHPEDVALAGYIRRCIDDHFEGEPQ